MPPIVAQPRQSSGIHAHPGRADERILTDARRHGQAAQWRCATVTGVSIDAAGFEFDGGLECTDLFDELRGCPTLLEGGLH